MPLSDGASFVSCRSLIARRTEFWWNERKPDEPMLWESKIELSEDFFNEIIQHPVPIDMNTLTALKRCALGLDLYLWLTYRIFTLRAPLRLTWRQLYQQFDTAPIRGADKQTVKVFRRKVLRELIKIKAAWPDLNYATDNHPKLDLLVERHLVRPFVLILLPPAIASSSDPTRLGE